MRVGFIGLGQMGRGMARRLLDAGHDLIAWNRSPDPCQALRDHGATIATRIEHTLEAEIVVSMLADDASVQAVWIEQGLPAVDQRVKLVERQAGRRLDESGFHGVKGVIRRA